MWQLYFKKSSTSYFFLAVCVASILCFWRLSYIVVSGELSFIDTWVMVWIISHRFEWLIPIFLAISSFGGIYTVSVIVILVSILLLHRHKSFKILAIGGALILAYKAFSIIKLMTAVSRPPSGIMTAYDFSFPSGHTTIATTFFLIVLYMLWPEIKKNRQKIYFSIATFILILAVGFSRMYLGMHWASDVLGGFLLGLSVFSFSIYVYKKFAIMAQFDFSRKKVENTNIQSY